MRAYDKYLDTAVAAADAARKVVLRHFRTRLTITTKPDASPQSVADLATEKAVRELILARHPEHSFFGEEDGIAGGDAGQCCWLVDPIDGTKSFLSGSPTFGVLISLLCDGVPCIGIIDHPALGERWVGVRGRVTTFNGAQCATADLQKLTAAILHSTTPDMFSNSQRINFDNLSAHAKFRVFGGDCYAYGLLANGSVHLVCEADLRAHDFAALVPVVQGAGGVISDWHGRELRINPKNGNAVSTVLASANAGLHKAALAKLK